MIIVMKTKIEEQEFWAFFKSYNFENKYELEFLRNSSLLPRGKFFCIWELTSRGQNWKITGSLRLQSFSDVGDSAESNSPWTSRPSRWVIWLTHVSNLRYHIQIRWNNDIPSIPVSELSQIHDPCMIKRLANEFLYVGLKKKNKKGKFGS